METKPKNADEYAITQVAETGEGYEVHWRCPNERHPKERGDWIGVFKQEPRSRSDAHYAQWLPQPSFSPISTDQHRGSLVIPVKGTARKPDLWVAYCHHYGHGPMAWTPVAYVQVRTLSGD